MKVVFLHIPKTAGQSVHAALVDAFGKDSVCPARVNDQLYPMSVAEINRYRVFSGHFDWSMLDCVQGPKFVFTVLREPRDRILSFYFFLRDQARALAPEELQKPERQGLKAALELSPNDYFCGGAPQLRRFLDDHYDNFYTYYFAGRRFDARGTLAGLMKRELLDREALAQLARDNLATLDAVYRVEDTVALFARIRELAGASGPGRDSYRVNVNTRLEADERLGALQELGADERTLQRLEEFCSMDTPLWHEVCAAAGGHNEA